MLNKKIPLSDIKLINYPIIYPISDNGHRGYQLVPSLTNYHSKPSYYILLFVTKKVVYIGHVGTLLAHSMPYVLYGVPYQKYPNGTIGTFLYKKLHMFSVFF